jgi:hypothetical protein
MTQARFHTRVAKQALEGGLVSEGLTGLDFFSEHFNEMEKCMTSLRDPIPEDQNADQASSSF